MVDQVEAVYFKPEDYASTPRRLTALLIDTIVVFLLFLVIGNIVVRMTVPADVLKSTTAEQKEALKKEAAPILGYLLLSLIGPATLYHIALRKTRGGTLGYRVAGIRLVNPFGQPPNIKTLLKRFLVAVPTCMFFAIAYTPSRKQPKRQAFHDQVAGTWLIRRRAEPAGSAQLASQPQLYGVYPFAFMLTFLDVVPAEQEEGQQTGEG